MSNNVDTRLVKDVLIRLRGLSRIVDEIQNICRRNSISSLTYSYKEDFAGNIYTDRSSTDGPGFFKVTFGTKSVANDPFFPYVLGKRLTFQENLTHPLLFIHGPILIQLRIPPIDTNNPIQYRGIITVATRILDEFREKHFAGWYLDIEVVCKPKVRSKNKINKILEDYIAKIGEFKDSGRNSSLDSILHYMMCHMLAKNVNAVSLVEQLGRNKIDTQSLLSFLGLKKSSREKVLKILKAKYTQIENSLVEFIDYYFSGLSGGMINELLSADDVLEIEKEAWKVNPNDPFDFLRIMFLILSIVIKEVTSVERDIRMMCGKSYNEVVKRLFIYDDLSRTVYPTSEPVSIFIPYGYRRSEDVNDVIDYWEDKFNSIGAYPDSEDDGFEKKIESIESSADLDNIHSFFRYSRDFAIHASETYLEKKQNFVFHRTYKTIEEDIAKRSSHFVNLYQAVSPEDKSITSFSLSNYSKSFSSLCAMFKRYIRASFTK